MEEILFLISFFSFYFAISISYKLILFLGFLQKKYRCIQFKNATSLENRFQRIVVLLAHAIGHFCDWIQKKSQ